MTNMQNFITWFLTQLPSFLLSEPICYLFGFILLGLVIKVITHLIDSSGSSWR